MSNRRKLKVRPPDDGGRDVAIQAVFAESRELVRDALARVELHPDERYREGFKAGMTEMQKLMIDATMRAAERERESQE
jgi:hypothetical protein